MGRSVQIPLSMFNQTIDLLESIDISALEYPVSCLYELVLYDFLKKRQKIELRQAYAGIIFADNDDTRFDARMNYLYDKRKVYGDG